MFRELKAVASALMVAGACLAVEAPRGVSREIANHPAIGEPTAEQSKPELPRRKPESAAGHRAGRTIAVPANGDLQAGLDDAKPGDVIALEPGATYRGPFRLRRKEGSGWIVISSKAPDGAFPRPGQRVNPSQASRMPKLVASSDSVVFTEPGAHHYRFVGIEFAPAPGVFLRDLIQLGHNET